MASTSRGSSNDHESSSESGGSEGSDARSLGEVWFNLMDRSNDVSPKPSSDAGTSADGRSMMLAVAGASPGYARIDRYAPPGGGLVFPTTISTTQKRNSMGSSDSAAGGGKNSKRRKRNLTEAKRVERNAREQARSNRLSEQFAELRDLLLKAGIVVPKGTKGSVLCLVRDYIRVLEENRKKVETEVQHLRQQLANMGQGNQGSQTAQALQLVTSRNGMPALVGGHCQDPGSAAFPDEVMNESHYRAAFDHCAIAMGIATLGGTLVDCNQLFCAMIQHEKEYLKTLSVFNLTAHDQLSYAFDRLSDLLTNSTAAPDTEAASINVSSTIPGLGLKITLLDHSTDSTTFQGDCRKKRLLITLLKKSPEPLPPGAFGLPTGPQAPVTGAPPQPTVLSGGMNLPSKEEQDPSAFYATG
ncbi:expressed unknown protein [Seminavis robusta]|uniref:BHLH domain-containing protein n=1 Tax=Seminavis robusta TaxID=568900 RepID=A0A9N8EIA3_9STRA|nr:expressed unknown protein [Seminavis robusta]|eukprot:Sro1270_g257970.1 n/a (414) ;mRNA; r:17773-19260